MAEVTVRSEWDRVFIKAGSTDIMMPYASAFKVAQHARLAAKHAMRMVGEEVGKWRGFAEVRDLTLIATPGPEVRKTLGGKFEWRIDLMPLEDRDDRVYFWFGNVGLVLHFEKALKLSTELRHHAKNAKAWSGDTGRSMNAAGTLRDAELNYKHGIT